MLVNLKFDDDFANVSKGTKVQVDMAFSDTIDNIKIMISLKYPDINPARIALFLDKQHLLNHETIKTTKINENSILTIKPIKSGICSCV